MTQKKFLLRFREVAALYGPPWYALSPRTARYDAVDFDAWLTH
ncbi:hypothetical protein [Arthrobacter crusticola]|nr:hypothetical protein [Arthrobacter crusticola]